MVLSRRNVLVAAALASIGAFSPIVMAQDYPTKPIDLIITFPPGSVSDQLARTLEPFVRKNMPEGTQFNFVYKPGAVGTIGLIDVLNSPADGYKIAVAAPAGMFIQPHLQGTYAVEDFQPIAKIVENAEYLAVPAESPFQTFDDWLNHARENSGARIGVVGIGNVQHLPLARLALDAGIDVEFIVYDGQPQAVAALLGNNLPAGGLASSVAKPYFEDGSLRPLVAYIPLESDVFGDTPKLSDFGFVDGLSFTGIVAKAGIPEDRLEILANAFAAASQDPEFIEQMTRQGFTVSYGDPDRYMADILSASETAQNTLREIDMID